MKVIVLSDLNWQPHLKRISKEEISSFSKSKLRLNRYERIRRYYEIIINEGAQLVLFAGDITGDGSCGHGYENALKLLFLLLEKDKIPSRYISGNHDLPKHYDNFNSFAEKLTYTEEISNRSCTVKGLQILGINFDSTNSKTRLEQSIQEHKSNYDIIIAHSEIKRRIRLFDFKAKCIITGHYDRKLLSFNDSTFISLDNDWEEVSYASLEYSPSKNHIAKINIRTDSQTILSLSNDQSNDQNNFLHANGVAAMDMRKIESYPDKELIDDASNSWVYLKHLRGQNLRSVFNTLWKVKNNIELSQDDLPLDQVYKTQVNPKYKISKVFIKDYLD